MIKIVDVGVSGTTKVNGRKHIRFGKVMEKVDGDSVYVFYIKKLLTIDEFESINCEDWKIVRKGNNFVVITQELWLSWETIQLVYAFACMN